MKKAGILAGILVFLILLVLSLVLDAPLDANKTFIKAKQKESPIVIGYTPVKCKHLNEISLIKKFIKKNNFKAIWKEVSLHEGLDLLSDKKLHIFSGCFQSGRSENYYRNIIFSRPYYKKYVLAVMPGENRFITHLEKFLKKEMSNHPKGQL